MNGFSERFGSAITVLSLKKTEIADRLNVSQAFVSQLCSGAKNPSDRTIADICREFNINEKWLRTGEGEMFQPRSRNEELLEFAAKAAEAGPSDIRAQLLTVMARLTDDQWQVLAAVAHQLAAEVNSQKEKDAGQTKGSHVGEH